MKDHHLQGLIEINYASKNLRGLNEVRIAKSKLLKQVKANRETHRKQYEKALMAWEIKFYEEVEKLHADNMAIRGLDDYWARLDETEKLRKKTQKVAYFLRR